MNLKKIEHTKGYLLLRIPNHPYANKNGYVPEHQAIMEAVLGRYLNPSTAVVHHKDENVKNNSLDNLLVVTKKEHRRLHNRWQRIDGEWWKTCSGCGIFLKVKDNFYRRNSGHAEYVSICKNCSRKSSRIKQQYYKQAKERIITCPVCGIKKRTPRYAKTIYCSKKCHWVVRKGSRQLLFNAVGVNG